MNGEKRKRSNREGERRGKRKEKGSESTATKKTICVSKVKPTSASGYEAVEESEAQTVRAAAWAGGGKEARQGASGGRGWGHPPKGATRRAVQRALVQIQQKHPKAISWRRK